MIKEDKMTLPCKRKFIRPFMPLIFIPLIFGCQWGLMTSEQEDAFEDDGGPDIAQDAVEAPDARDAVDLGDDGAQDPRPDGIIEEDVPIGPDADILEGEPIPCTEGELTCTAGGAERCEGGTWVDIGPCPLGCSESSDNCYIPSNIAADLIDPSAGNLDLGSGDADIYINTETGEITGSSANVLRPAGAYDAATGTSFAVVTQGSGAPDIGVLSVGEFTLPAGTTLHGQGGNALAIAASGGMIIDGVIDLCAGGQNAGAGGGAGGNAEAAGAGNCPGSPGSGTGTNHTSGGGGGGLGGAGGKGGDEDSTTPPIAGGAGGGPCGTPELSPLIGGSGGGGGGLAVGYAASAPGAGGGGGGAIQLVSAISITFGAGGGIHAGGAGGGGANVAGGGGAGAGGGVLIEAPDVNIASGAIIAANGGGGGAGDCT
jgi:hypothetical protein